MKALGPVRALEFDTSGTTLWSGDDKVTNFSPYSSVHVFMNPEMIIVLLQ